MRFLLHEVPTAVKFMEAENGWVVTAGLGGSRKGELFNGNRFSNLQYEKGLEVCFTAMCMYLILMNLKGFTVAH